MKKYIAIGFSIVLVIFSNNTFADDLTEADMLIELQSIDKLNAYMQEYQLAMEGYEKLMQGDIAGQLAALTGTSDLGALLNDEGDQEARAWSPSEWASTLSGGNNSRYKQLLEDYQKAHPTLSTSEASSGMSSTYATDYQQQVDTNQAASTQASYAFNDTNSHLETINKLSEEINKETDTKRIQDLNARINAEIAYLQVEVIKGLAVMNEQMAQQQATEIHDRTEAAKFNKIPD